MKTYRAIVILLFTLGCFRAAAYDVQLTSTDKMIVDKIRSGRNSDLFGNRRSSDFFSNETSAQGSIVSNRVTIDDDIRKRKNYWFHDWWWETRHGNMAGVKLGRSSNGGTGTGDFRISFVSSPKSLSVTMFSTKKDGNLVGPTPNIHEFGESPDFEADSPVGDAIVPLMILLSLLVAVKKIKR